MARRARMTPGEIQRRHGTTRKDKSRQKRYREEDFAWHPCAKMTPGQPALTASLSSKTVAGVAALRYDDQGMLVDAAQGHEVRRSNHARRRCTGSFGIRAPQTHTKIDSPKIDIFLGFRTWDPGTQAPGALGTRGRDPGPGPRDPGAQDPGPRDGPRTHRPRDPGPGTQGPGTQGAHGARDPGTRGPDPGTRDPGPRARTRDPGTRGPDRGTQGPGDWGP